ncbi:hypothetical protein KW787_02040 [Candidatus Pacearchaeota archaeon]|nr:hypothetical protein [Candidatus Pacearchaeota archaeon]
MYSKIRTISFQRVDDFSKQRIKVMDYTRGAIKDYYSSDPKIRNEFSQQSMTLPNFDTYGVTYIGENSIVVLKHYRIWSKNRKTFLGKVQLEVASPDKDESKGLLQKIADSLEPCKQENMHVWSLPKRQYS